MTAAGASWSNGCNRHFEIAEDRSTQDGLWLGSLEGVGCKDCTCPLWVKSGHVQCKMACPLYFRKRTYAVQ